LRTTVTRFALQILRERGIEADEERVQEVVEMLSEQVSND